MSKSSRVLSILLAIVGGLTFTLVGLLINSLSMVNVYKNQLENAYMRSFYEVVDNINTLEVDISKIIATNSLEGQRELLSDIYNDCMMGVGNIAVLPIKGDQILAITKLLNNAGGYAYSLLLSNYEGNMINDNDYQQISTIHDSILALKYDINDYVKYLKYDYSVLDDIDWSSSDNSEFSGGLAGTESSSAEVPTLIYDGPFSDSVINKEIKGLPDSEVTIDKCTQIVQDVLPSEIVVFRGESDGKFATYNFEVGDDNVKYVSVTKRGGFVLTITSYGGGGGSLCSNEKAIDIAQNFAEDLGLHNMYEVWHQVSGSIMYVNLAPIIDGVIYYTDLIKVKVDMCLQSVVGWEASSYATNHIARTFDCSIGIIEGQHLISKELNVIERNLCIIPNEFVGESSAYEYVCTWKDYTYYIYIDSHSGKQLNILRVIETNNGSLLM